MRVIPVLDLMGRQVVHGIAGNRRDYRPIRSILTSSSEPLVVAQALRDHFGFAELYIADLDAFGGSPCWFSLYRALHGLGFSLLVDAGLHAAADSNALVHAKIEGLVAGLETLESPQVLLELVQSIGAERVVFSLDLKNGKPLSSSSWPAESTDAIASQAIDCGVSRILVLDLAYVGLGMGTGTASLCQELKITHQNIEVLAGGGVRGPGDLECLRHSGVDAVLVASALHDGRLRRGDIT
jgi:phosphoribosylformimino-5-aminoimidazole carboxamide ribotide isomerase